MAYFQSPPAFRHLLGTLSVPKHSNCGKVLYRSSFHIFLHFGLMCTLCGLLQFVLPEECATMHVISPSTGVKCCCSLLTTSKTHPLCGHVPLWENMHTTSTTGTFCVHFGLVALQGNCWSGPSTTLHASSSSVLLCAQNDLWVHGPFITITKYGRCLLKWSPCYWWTVQRLQYQSAFQSSDLIGWGRIY